MSWSSARPDEARWKPADLFAFLREVFTRGKTFGSFTWNPPNIGAATTVDTTLTTSDAPAVKGLRVGQAVYVSPPSTLDTGLVFGGAYVATDDTLTIRLGNVTAGAINPASGTWAFAGVVN